MIDQILDRHFHTIASLAANVGIDANAINFYSETGSRPITRGIHLSKEYKGKVFCYVNHWTAPNGKTYPNITFGTHKHGVIEKFNGWLESRDDHQSPLINLGIFERTTKPAFVKPIAPPKSNNEDVWRKKELEAAHTAWNNASAENVASHPYIVSKGVSVEGLDIRRGIGKFGDCIMVQIKNLNAEVLGYQQIYADKIPNKETNKHFVGTKKGGFVVIGDASRVKYGAWYCEGLATGLSIYQANGNGKTTLSNAKKLPVVVCLDAENLKTVVIAHHEEGCENIRIAADNDCGKQNGNTGVSVALEVAKTIDLKHFYLPQKGGEKCDFNDTLEFTKKLTTKNLVDFHLQILRVCQIQQVKKHGETLAKVISRQVPYPYSKQDAINLVIKAMAERGIDAKLMPERIINKSFTRRTAKVKKLNTICNKIGLTLHVMPEWTNEQIAESIKQSMGGIWLDNRGLGAGKTKLLEIMRKLLNDCGIAYITHRVSLVKDACGRLSIENYQETEPNQRIQHLGLCVNSMPKYEVSARFNVIFLDEVRQIIEHCSIGAVNNRQAVHDQLAKAVETADLVIASDADINDDTVNFLRTHANGKKLNWIFATTPKNNKSIHLVKDFKAIRVKILNQLIASENIVVACTTKAESIKMHTYLLENGIDENAMLLVHANNKGDAKQAEFLANPNVECVKFRCLIHSPTIGSGVSIETEHFTTNFMLDSGNLPANDCLQMTARNRRSDSIFYSFDYQNNFERCTDVEMLIEGENEKHQNYLGKGQFELNELGWNRIKHIANRHEDLNDHANSVLILAELKGMAIDYSELQTCVTDDENLKQKGLGERVKEQRATDILKAEVIDDFTVEEFGKKFALTQNESNQLNRHLTTVMAGTKEISTDDTLNLINNKMKVLTNYEMTKMNVEDLKKWDESNHVTKNKLQSKSSQQKLFNAVLDVVRNNSRIDKTVAIEACEVLRKNAPELAANGFTDYRKQSKNPVRTLKNFLEKMGYTLTQSLKTENERFYQLETISYIERYANNREALRLAQTALWF